MAGSSAGSAGADVERFNVLCFVALLPPALRAAALEELAGADPDLFHLGFDPPTVLSGDVVAACTTRTRAALAGRVGARGVQQALAEVDAPEVDAALHANPRLGYGVERLLRMRDPESTAAGPCHRPGFHRRALAEPHPELAAAALLDRRGQAPPTAWAAAWRTVRRAGGVAEVRRVLARSPAAGPADPVTGEVAAALAEPDPAAFLAAVDERHLGTGALLRRLRGRADAYAAREVLAEPYALDWALIAADHLREALPAAAVCALVEHPDCPPRTAFVLTAGRPPRPGQLERRAAARAATPPRPEPAGRPALVPPPDSTGPLGGTAAGARAVLRALPVNEAGGPAWNHVRIAVERGLLTPADVVARSHQATSLTVWTGQESGRYEEEAVPHSGRAAIRREVRAHLTAWYADHPPPPGGWTALRAVVRTFPGTLPALLRAVSG
jgi:hypothetical protein